MKKPESLLAALVAALDPLHHVKGDTSRLQMIMSNVRPEASGRPGSGFQLAYTVEIHMPDFNGDPLEVVIPMMSWIERWQHDLIANPEKAAKAIDMTFVRLDDRRYDLHAAVDLTEMISFAPRPGGGHDVVACEEPLPMALETAEPLHAVFLDDQLIMHCSAHPGAGV